MKKKTLLILAGVFVLLLAFATFPSWGKYFSSDKTNTLTTEFDFSRFTEDSVKTVSILQNGEERRLTKENSSWAINGFPADQEEVKVFFEGLGKIEPKELVSKNSANHSKYGVTEEGGITVRFNDKDEFIVGNTGPQYTSFYLRRKDSNQVYLVSGSVRNKFTQNVSAWRDKTMIQVEKDAIRKIELTEGRKTRTVEKNEEGKWYEGENEVKPEVMEKFFTTLSPLKASGFLNEEEAAEFTDATGKRSMKLFANGEDPVISLEFLEKESGWWGQVVGNDTLYKIPSYNVENISLEGEDIFVGEEG